MKTTLSRPASIPTMKVRSPRFNVVLTVLLLSLGAYFADAQPIITRHPTHLSLSIGATAKFQVFATTQIGPMTCQWLRDNKLLLNAANTSLTITNIQLTNAGDYVAVLTDSTGSTSSAPARLDVDPAWTKITSDPLVADPGYLATGSWADLDFDGDLDLLLIRFDHPGPNPLYRNNGDGSFTRVVIPSLQSALAVDGLYCWGDYDNDGYVDLFVPEGQKLPLKNLLYHNNGDETFTPVTEGPVVLEGGLSSGAAWGDFDRDGWLDLCVANGSAGARGSPPQKNSLYRNQGDGTFLRVAADQAGPILDDLGYFDLPIWVDVNNDGWQDLFIVSTEGTYNPLYLNQRGEGFIKVSDDPLVKEFDPHWGDAAWADFDNDGDLDVFLTTARASIGLSVPGPVALFQNDGQGHFTKLTAGDIGPLADEHADTYVGCWGDYDNDGWLDLYLSNTTDPSQGANRTDLLYHNQGGRKFLRETRGSPANELGAAFGGWLVDVTNDGFLDLLCLKPPAPDNCRIRYYRNNGNSNHWLAVKCIGTASPRLASGTKLRVKAMLQGQPIWQLRVIDPGGCANAQNFTAHFGLGHATSVDVLRIEWTSGIVQELTKVAVDQYLTVTEPAKLSMPHPGELQIPGWKGMACSIEASADLTHWTRQTALTNLHLTGGIYWTDPSTSTQSFRFYRAEVRLVDARPGTVEQSE